MRNSLSTIPGITLLTSCCFPREELEGFVSSGTLSHLKVCFSRDGREDEEVVSSAEKPRYVQHNLLLNSQRVTDILLRQNGYLYVCG